MSPAFYVDLRRTLLVALVAVTVVAIFFALFPPYKARPPARLVRQAEQRREAMQTWCPQHGYTSGYAAVTIDSAGDWQVIGGCK